MSIRSSPIRKNGGSKSRPRCVPSKDQPFYHLFAENAETQYVAYVSEQNLLPDESGEPVRANPQIDEMFVRGDDGSYRMRMSHRAS